MGSDKVTWREHRAAYLLELPDLGPVSLSIFILNSWLRNITHREPCREPGIHRLSALGCAVPTPGKALPASKAPAPRLATPISGMKFYDLVEALREALHKKVDVLNREQLNDNPELMHEILKDGIKIYG